MKKLALLFSIVLVLSCNRAESRAPLGVGSNDVARSAAPAEAQRGDASGAGLSLMQTPAAVAGAPEAAPMPRMIVRTANVRITVADTGKAVDAVTRSVEGVGGYVSGSNIWREGELLRAKLTLRVPANQLTSALASIRKLAKRVDNEVIASEDVSQEFVDLDSRVRNLEATEEELRQLLVVARQNSRKATEVLEVHQQLMNIRGEIEQAKGRMRYLSQVTSMSTIALEVTPDAIAQPVVEPGWQPLVVAKSAVRALIGVMQSLANVAIWLLIYVLPLIGILALVIVPIWKIARRSRAGEA
ncbi:MAG TPA: DUF4349 domain-containing protein [Thermoanaerobaculia bacterium]|nr:DUF4349 domain-containing protein [Thermoanaerobaculia bacterium]